MCGPVWQPTPSRYPYPIEGCHMANEDWGVKRLCPTTGKRFYDMNRTPIISPYTGETVELETNRKNSVVSTRVKEKPEAVVESDEEDVVLDDEDDSVDLEIDDNLLEDDDEDDDTVALDDIADVPVNDDDS